MEGKPCRGNASMDYTDTAATMTFFFAIDSKSVVPSFNCSIRNTSKCQTSCLLIYLCLQASFFIGRTQLRQQGLKHGRIRRGRGRWHQQWRITVIELYVLLCPCVKTIYVDFCVKTMSCCVIYVLLCEDYELLLCCIIFCYMPCFGRSPFGEAAKTGVI
jgi:hypothetical protein